MGEQLVAAGMHGGDDLDRQLVVDRDDMRERQIRVEIQLVASEFLLLGCDGRVDVTDIGKPLGAQQRLTDILRRETDHRYLAEPDGVGLPCWLSRTRGPPRGETGAAGERSHG